ncbi:hypothetical protein OF83DRAFT_688124 [Amylostereum chailletii]|nr:hypothetical protein OF83DRAFT_688124 [Amylostereum chailletii]
MRIGGAKARSPGWLAPVERLIMGPYDVGGRTLGSPWSICGASSRALVLQLHNASQRPLPAARRFILYAVLASFLALSGQSPRLSPARGPLQASRVSPRRFFFALAARRPAHLVTLDGGLFHFLARLAVAPKKNETLKSPAGSTLDTRSSLFTRRDRSNRDQGCGAGVVLNCAPWPCVVCSAARLVLLREESLYYSGCGANHKATRSGALCHKESFVRTWKQRRNKRRAVTVHVRVDAFVLSALVLSVS